MHIEEGVWQLLRLCWISRKENRMAEISREEKTLDLNNVNDIKVLIVLEKEFLCEAEENFHKNDAKYHKAILDNLEKLEKIEKIVNEYSFVEQYAYQTLDNIEQILKE